jgi:hypothetical protein
MPQPFQDIMMEQLQAMSVAEMFTKLEKPGMTPAEKDHATKIAELSHFLVQNYRDELSPNEHVIDAAIRLLRKDNAVKEGDRNEAQ